MWWHPVEYRTVIRFAKHGTGVGTSSNRTSGIVWRMPRVSDAHLARRRRQIVDAAAQLVAAKGMHATSMRDVIAASGMSAGAVYHYYPAKSSLMEAIGDMIEERYSAAARELAARPDTPDPVELIHALTTSMIPADGAADLSGVGVAVWAEAMHDDVVAASTRRVFTTLRGGLATIARRWRDDGRLPPDADPEEIAAVLYGLMPGYVVQRLIIGDVDPDSYARGVAALIGYRA